MTDRLVDLEHLMLRATRDEADQFHYGHGAGDHDDAEEAHYRRINNRNVDSVLATLAGVWDMAREDPRAANPFGDRAGNTPEVLEELLEALKTHRVKE